MPVKIFGNCAYSYNRKENGPCFKKYYKICFESINVKPFQKLPITTECQCACTLNSGKEL